METEVCICGAGTMGRGIALAVAGHGVRAILYDLSADMIGFLPGRILLDRDHVDRNG